MVTIRCVYLSLKAYGDSVHDYLLGELVPGRTDVSYDATPLARDDVELTDLEAAIIFSLDFDNDVVNHAEWSAQGVFVSHLLEFLQCERAQSFEGAYDR